MKSVQLLLLVLVLVGSSVSWPLAPEELERRLQDAEEMASKDTEAFIQALVDKDGYKLTMLTLEMQKVMSEARFNVNNLNQPLLELGLYLNNIGIPQPDSKPIDQLKGRAIAMLTEYLDQNRRKDDAFFQLTTVARWLHQRVLPPNHPNAVRWTEAREAAIAARDALQALNQVFADAVKDLRGKPDREEWAALNRIGADVTYAIETIQNTLKQATDQADHAIDLAVYAFL